MDSGRRCRYHSMGGAGRMEKDRKNETEVRVWTFRTTVLQDERNGRDARRGRNTDRSFRRMWQSVLRTLPQKTIHEKRYVHGQRISSQLRRCVGRRQRNDGVRIRERT